MIHAVEDLGGPGTHRPSVFYDDHRGLRLPYYAACMSTRCEWRSKFVVEHAAARDLANGHVDEEAALMNHEHAAIPT